MGLKEGEGGKEWSGRERKAIKNGKVYMGKGDLQKGKGREVEWR